MRTVLRGGSFIVLEKLAVAVYFVVVFNFYIMLFSAFRFIDIVVIYYCSVLEGGSFCIRKPRDSRGVQ